MLTASATPDPAQPRGVARFSFVAHFAEVEVDTETGRGARHTFPGGAR